MYRMTAMVRQPTAAAEDNDEIYMAGISINISTAGIKNTNASPINILSQYTTVVTPDTRRRWRIFCC